MKSKKLKTIFVMVCLAIVCISSTSMAKSVLSPSKTKIIKPAGHANLLAKNIYFEASTESLEGKLAVALVTLNRVYDSRWPNTITKVIRQNRQFSWTHDGKSDTPRNKKVFDECKLIAKIAIILYNTGKIKNEKVADCFWYHGDYIKNPVWTKRLTRQGKIGRHIFYKEG